MECGIDKQKDKDQRTGQMEQRREPFEIQMENERIETRLSDQATGGEEFRQQNHRGEHLSVGIIQAALDEHGTRRSIEPRQLMQCAEIRSQITQTTAELVGIASTAIREMITGVTE